MTDHPERRMMQSKHSIRPGDATVAADMCPGCKGDNTEAFSLCQTCARLSEHAGHGSPCETSPEGSCASPTADPCSGCRYVPCGSCPRADNINEPCPCDDQADTPSVRLAAASVEASIEQTLGHADDGQWHDVTVAPQHRFTAAPHDPEAERIATERAIQQAEASEEAAKWLGAVKAPSGTDVWGRLTELSQLEDGWLDGHGTAPSADVLQTAGNTITALRLTGTVLIAPTEEGGVNIEWSDRNGGHELEIMPDLSVLLMTIDPQEQP